MRDPLKALRVYILPYKNNKIHNIGKKGRIIRGVYGGIMLVFSLYFYYFFYLKLPTPLMFIFNALLITSGYMGLLQAYEGFCIECGLKGVYEENGELKEITDPAIKIIYKWKAIKITIISLILAILTLILLYYF